MKKRQETVMKKYLADLWRRSDVLAVGTSYSLASVFAVFAVLIAR